MSNSIPLSKRMACSVCGGWMWKTWSSLPEGVARCRGCRGGHGSNTKYKHGCRCAVCKSGQALRMREYSAKRKAEGRPLGRSRPTVERACDECGVIYSVRVDRLRGGGGRLCSRKCASVLGLRAAGVESSGKSAETRARHREFGKAGSVRWRALRRARASLELSGGNRVFVNGPCIVCGTEFMVAGQFARYCSAECRDRNSKQGFGLSWLDRMALYSRDEYNCHLCGLKVLYGGVEDYDPRMATLDHLVPQAHGGGHGFENLATAHSLCNSVRRELPVSMFRSHEAVSELRKRLFEAVNDEA